MSPGRRVRIDLAYDGTRFAGWQVQPRRLTVQGVVEAALSLDRQRRLPLNLTSGRVVPK